VQAVPAASVLHLEAQAVQVKAAPAASVRTQAVQVQAVQVRVASVLHMEAQAVQVKAVQRPVPAHTVRLRLARPAFSPEALRRAGSRSPDRNRSLRRRSSAEHLERTVPSETCETRS
jgi:hypothetical protein